MKSEGGRVLTKASVSAGREQESVAGTGLVEVGGDNETSVAVGIIGVGEVGATPARTSSGSGGAGGGMTGS